MNYAGLRVLLSRYNASGLQLLAFPSNQFGGQAPASDECERAFAYQKVGVPYGTFPVFDKVDINGPTALPLFRFLKRQPRAKLPLCAGCDTAWNYEKFLVDGEGRVVSRYASATSPLEAEPKIRELLGLLS